MGALFLASSTHHFESLIHPNQDSLLLHLAVAYRRQFFSMPRTASCTNNRASPMKKTRAQSPPPPPPPSSDTYATQNAQREQQEQQRWLHLDRPIHGNGPKARDTTRGQKKGTTDEEKRQPEERVTEPKNTPHLYCTPKTRPPSHQNKPKGVQNAQQTRILKKKAPHTTCTTAVVAFKRCHHRPRRRARYSLRMPLAHISHLAAYPLFPFQGLKAQTKKKTQHTYSVRRLLQKYLPATFLPPSCWQSKGTSPRRLSQNK